MSNELDQFDVFDFVSNQDLENAYYEAVRDNDPDLDKIANEMVKRGLLGRC